MACQSVFLFNFFCFFYTFSPHKKRAPQGGQNCRSRNCDLCQPAAFSIFSPFFFSFQSFSQSPVSEVNIIFLIAFQFSPLCHKSCTSGKLKVINYLQQEAAQRQLCRPTTTNVAANCHSKITNCPFECTAVSNMLRGNMLPTICCQLICTLWRRVHLWPRLESQRCAPPPQSLR